jgi:hypothetical protein
MNVGKDFVVSAIPHSKYLAHIKEGVDACETKNGVCKTDFIMT